MPTNGVVYVEDCVNSAVCTTASPMATTSTIDPGEEGVSTQNQNSVGDAIVQGSVTNPLTIGCANNIVIDGNLCYTDDVSGGTCTTTADVAVDQRARVGGRQLRRAQPPMAYTTSTAENITGNAPRARRASATARRTCDLSNPIIDAVILALKGSFLVNYWDQGSPLGSHCPMGSSVPNCITLNGTIDQAWRGPVGTGSPSVSHGLRQELPVGLPPGIPVAAVLLEPGDVAVGLRLVHQRVGRVQDADRPDLSHAGTRKPAVRQGVDR